MLAIPAMLSAFIPLWIALLSGPLLFLVALSITKREITERSITERNAKI
jgi:hypothetical protein